MNNKTVVVCGVVLAVLVALYLLKVPPNTLITFGIFLACPLMHIFMMKGMHHGDDHQQKK